MIEFPDSFWRRAFDMVDKGFTCQRCGAKRGTPNEIKGRRSSNKQAQGLRVRLVLTADKELKMLCVRCYHEPSKPKKLKRCKLTKEMFA